MLARRISEFGQRTVVRITTDRRLAQKLKDCVLLDFEAEFFRYLIETAKDHGFGGHYASVQASGLPYGSIAAFKLRWQNDQGEPTIEEFVPVVATMDGQTEDASNLIVQLLVSRLVLGTVANSDLKIRADVFRAMLARVNRRLETESTRFKHPNGLVQLAAADCRGG